MSDVEGLRELIADLDRAAYRAPAEVKVIGNKAAINIKKDWKARWAGLSHAPALPSSITDDVTFTAAGLDVEVGPDKSRAQGALGNLIEYGSRNNAPRPGGLPALQAEEPRTVRALEDLAERLISGG